MNTRRHHRLTGVMVTVVALLSIAGSAVAQTFNMYNIDASRFPTIRADYMALDQFGQPYTTPPVTAQEFTVRETAEGQIEDDVSAQLKHQCIELQEDPEASILIVLDRSGSMDSLVNGALGRQKRWLYAVEAVKKFVFRIKTDASLRYLKRTRVAVVSFASNYEVFNLWTDNPQEISDTLDRRKPTGVTAYRAPFDERNKPNVYDLLRQRPADIPRYVFWITDGHPTPFFASEAEGARWAQDTVVPTLNSLNARFFAITLNEANSHYSLNVIAQGTNGKALLMDEDKLLDLFPLLALETQSRLRCYLEWESKRYCKEESVKRSVRASFARVVQPEFRTSYYAPETAVAKATYSADVLFCGDPPASGTSTATLKIKATNGDLRIDTMVVAPADYFTITNFGRGPNAKYVLREGDSVTVTVQFRQGAVKTYRDALLTVNAQPCSKSIKLVAGTGQVQLNSPVGGEVFSTCEKVRITWSGVLPTQPVDLYYNDNDGNGPWTTIRTGATGLQFDWTPPAPGVTYRVRVAVTTSSAYQWAKQIGAAGSEYPKAIAIDNEGLRLYVAGWYDGPTKIDQQVVNNTAGNIDGFLTRMNTGGTFLSTILLTGNGNNEEKIVGVVTDNAGNYYVAGHFASPNARLGNIILDKRNANDGQDAFIQVYGQNDQPLALVLIGGSSDKRSTVELTNIGTRYQGQNFQVVVTGRYQRYVEAGIGTNGLPVAAAPRNDNTWVSFYAVYAYDPQNPDSDLIPTVCQAGQGPPTFKYADSTVTFEPCIYETGRYSGVKRFIAGESSITLPFAGGQTDGFVSRLCSVPGSESVSTSSFAVKAPVLEFNPSAVTIAVPVAQGQSSSSEFPDILQNNGDFDVTVESATFVGGDAADFSLATTLVGTRIVAGTAVKVAIDFLPKGVGPRSTTLVVTGSCGTRAELVINATGLEPCRWSTPSPLDLGKVVKGQSAAPQNNVCILRNDGPVALSGTFVIDPSSSADIIIVPKAPVTLPPGTFTIPPQGCLNVDISFSPSRGGLARAIIHFNLPETCGEATAEIRGEGVEPIVLIDTVDLRTVRLGTTRDSVITITNRTTQPATIASIAVLPGGSSDFAITLPAPNTIIPADGGMVELPVVFSPTARGPHFVEVGVSVTGIAEPLVGRATGLGILPALDTTGYVFQPVTVGILSSETGTIRIENTDATTAMVVNNITFDQATTEFGFTATFPAGYFPLTINPNDGVDIPVWFQPSAAGLRVAYVRVEHDARPGPSTPYATDRVQVRGIGIVGDGLPPVNFGDVLTCESRTSIVTIVNPNPTASLIVTNITPASPSGAFSIGIGTPFSVDPGGQREIPVTFTPTALGPATETFNLENTQGLSLILAVSGNGITVPANFTFGTLPPATVGQMVPVPIYVTVPASPALTLTDVSIALSHPRALMRFNSMNTAQQAAGWTFNQPTGMAGAVNIRATNATGAPLTSGIFVTPLFDVFLTADSSLSIAMTVSSSMSCMTATGDDDRILMQQVCYTAGRLVDISSQKFGLAAPAPNPALDHTRIAYGIGLSTNTTFELVDAVGNTVKTIETGVMPAGAYELDLDVRTLGAGVYYLRMTSGPYSSTTPVMVVK